MQPTSDGKRWAVYEIRLKGHVLYVGMTGNVKQRRYSKERQMSFGDGDCIKIDYTNYRGERSERHIRPREIFYGKTSWHPEPQWMLRAWDFDKGALREFALAGVHGWVAA